MQTNIAIAVGAAVIIVLGAWFFLTGMPVAQAPQDAPVLEAPSEEAGSGESVVVRGTVTGVNLEQMMVDGPGLVTLETEAGETVIVAVPSMGLPLCEAREAIADVSAISEGDVVEVSGEVSSESHIVPCVSVEHYLRLIVE